MDLRRETVCERTYRFGVGVMVNGLLLKLAGDRAIGALLECRQPPRLDACRFVARTFCIPWHENGVLHD